ncbi:ABC transporter ATP-binding protein [Salinispirillum sp. LH 10-3-1]|uniref:ABC-type dipeptide transporter n=1 Tax=Salinispirillum sp. LH 10-3-1 TaxID=2952525 RepID=A0AB38YFF1_9GAMM
MARLLEIKHLSTEVTVGSRAIRIVDDVNLSVDKGETLAIVGESGSGKSMTSLSIMGLLPKPGCRIAEGEVRLAGVDLVSLPEDRMFGIRGAEIAMIFQEPMTSLNPVLTIGEQIIEVLVYHKKIPRQEARMQAIALLQKVGFARAEAMLKEYPHQLSGGMRQRVMIAIALSCNPRVLIADEPTTALDVTVQAQILELMKALTTETEAAVILITHDLGVVAELADRVVVMYAGQVVEDATVLQLFDNPQHPYTWGLMQSIPRLDEDRPRLNSIPGNVPSPMALPTGCRFCTRCPHAQDICRTQAPPMVELADGQKVRCFIPAGQVQPQPKEVMA